MTVKFAHNSVESLFIKLKIEVALLLSSTLDERGVSQKKFAKIIGWSKKKVERVVCFENNLTLKEIARIFYCLSLVPKIKVDNKEKVT